MIYNEKKVEMLRQRYPEGTRICLDSMDNDPRPIPPGTKGIVQFVDDAGTLHCKFDNGRTLGVIPDVDKFHKIAQEQSQIDKQTEENIECEEITETEDWFCQYHLTHFIRTRIMQRERYDHSRAFFGLPEADHRWRCRFFCWPSNS